MRENSTYSKLCVLWTQHIAICRRIILGLAGMESTFPTAAHTVFCSALVAWTALTFQQSFFFLCCWALLAQYQDSLQSPQSSRLWMGKRWGGNTARTGDINWPKWPISKDIPQCMMSCSAIKVWKAEGNGRMLIKKTPAFTRNCSMYWGPVS